MKKFTHAWLAFMAIKRLEEKNLSDTLSYCFTPEKYDHTNVTKTNWQFIKAKGEV